MIFSFGESRGRRQSREVVQSRTGERRHILPRALLEPRSLRGEPSPCVALAGGRGAGLSALISVPL